MRIDHIAYRTKDRRKTAQFFIDAMGYRIQQEFDLDFGDGTTAKCIALEPPEKMSKEVPWTYRAALYVPDNPVGFIQEYHLPPELFVSDGSENSIVGDWVQARGGIGGIHHIAYMVSSVEQTMKEWREKGYAEFSTEEPIKCPGLTQVFTKPSELTGIIYEFIERTEFGFCRDNVRSLMESTKGL